MVHLRPAFFCLTLFSGQEPEEGGGRREAHLFTLGLVVQEQGRLCCRDWEGRDLGPAWGGLHPLLLVTLPPVLVLRDVPRIRLRRRLVSLLLLCVGHAGCLRLSLDDCEGGSHPRRWVRASRGQRRQACQRRGRAREQGRGHLEPGRWLRLEGSLSLVIERGHAQAVLERRVHVAQGQAAGPAVVAAASLEWCRWRRGAWWPQDEPTTLGRRPVFILGAIAIEPTTLGSRGRGHEGRECACGGHWQEGSCGRACAGVGMCSRGCWWGCWGGRESPPLVVATVALVLGGTAAGLTKPGCQRRCWRCGEVVTMAAVALSTKPVELSAFGGEWRERSPRADLGWLQRAVGHGGRAEGTWGKQQTRAGEECKDSRLCGKARVRKTRGGAQEVPSGRYFLWHGRGGIAWRWRLSDGGNSPTRWARGRGRERGERGRRGPRRRCRQGLNSWVGGHKRRRSRETSQRGKVVDCEGGQERRGGQRVQGAWCGPRAKAQCEWGRAKAHEREEEEEVRVRARN